MHVLSNALITQTLMLNVDFSTHKSEMRLVYVALIEESHESDDKSCDPSAG